MSRHKSQILVVGGSGFIGRHVMRRAIEEGFVATSLSRRSHAQNPAVAHIVADLTNAAMLHEKLAGYKFDYVVNCGGYVDHRSFFKGGRSVIEGHLMGLVNLVECLDRETLKGFVNLGSSDEYGAAPAPQVENLREAPISPYSLAKLAATQFLQMMHRTEGFPATTLRLFLTYGPGQDRKRFIPQIISGCLSGEAFPTSKGDQLRDFCYIDDTVDAIFSALGTKESFGEVINIASGRPVRIRNMIEAISTSIGSGFPQYGALSYRTGENLALYADITKARDILGWSAQTDLAAGLARTIEFFKK